MWFSKEESCVKQNLDFGGFRNNLLEGIIGEKYTKIERNHTFRNDKSTKLVWKLEGLILFLDLYWSSLEVWRKRKFKRDDDDFYFNI